MSRVIKNQQYYDEELAAAGKRRSYCCELVSAVTGLAPIYREIIIAAVDGNFDKTPWWKRSKPRRRKKS